MSDGSRGVDLNTGRGTPRHAAAAAVGSGWRVLESLLYVLGASVALALPAGPAAAASLPSGRSFAPPWANQVEDPIEPAVTVHPAIHARRTTPPAAHRLFPRAAAAGGRVDQSASVDDSRPAPAPAGAPEQSSDHPPERPKDSQPPPAPVPGAGLHAARKRSEERLDAMRRHPAGRARPHCTGTWTVQPGDSLWSIAQRALRTEDIARVARYWPKIHRANRATIGRDPSLIYAGQILDLPDECSE